MATIVEDSKEQDSVEPSPKRVKANPVGVILIDDATEHNQLAGVKKLLRAPRYFDDACNAEASLIRCFNCGYPGHTARQCTRQAKEKPCYLCAQFGHDGKTCPNKLCYRCGRPGHMARDCSYGNNKMNGIGDLASVCLRCGEESCPCANKGDYFRYEGGCTNEYESRDLQFVRCVVCGVYGHLSCKSCSKVPPQESCSQCGGEHFEENCTEQLRPHLVAERAEDGRRQNQEYLQQLEQAQYDANMERSRTSFGNSGGARSVSAPRERRASAPQYSVPMTPQAHVQRSYGVQAQQFQGGARQGAINWSAWSVAKGAGNGYGQSMAAQSPDVFRDKPRGALGQPTWDQEERRGQRKSYGRR